MKLHLFKSSFQGILLCYTWRFKSCRANQILSCKKRWNAELVGLRKMELLLHVLHVSFFAFKMHTTHPGMLQQIMHLLFKVRFFLYSNITSEASLIFGRVSLLFHLKLHVCEERLLLTQNFILKCLICVSWWYDENDSTNPKLPVGYKLQVLLIMCQNAVFTIKDDPWQNTHT